MAERRRLDRCGHGFAREIVFCSKCGPLAVVAAAAASVAPAPLSDKYNFVDMTGLTVGGSTVEARAADANGKTRWLCTCGACGGRFVARAQWLRGRDRRGQRVTCPDCTRAAAGKARAGVAMPKLKTCPIPAEHVVSLSRTVRSVG